MAKIALLPLLGQINGATFVSIDTATNVKLTGGKKNPHQDRVTKVTRGSNVMLFQNKEVNGYEAMVKRRLEKEGVPGGTFELKPRQWGERLRGLPLVVHKDNFYLEVIFLKPGTTTYYLDATPIDRNAIVGLPPAREEGHQGGLEDKVIIRTFALSSITAITINGERYEGEFTVS